MDIVIPYRQSRTDELRYTLRGLKHIPHGDLYIIGDKPKFRGLKHIPYKHGFDAVQNTYNILMLAANSPDISEDFVWMHDDMMILEPMRELPVFHMGSYEDLLKELPRFNFYTQMKRKTADALKAEGIEDPLFYDVHVPFVFNKQKLIDIKDKLHGVNKISFYANYHGIEGRRITRDFKVRKDEDFDLVFVSTFDPTFNTSRAGQYIKEKLSEPSEYERKPTVSVLMPTYNDADLIIKALDSIPDNVAEIIIVNDGSTDNTAELLKEWAKKDPRAKVYTNRKNKGVGYTINRCYDLATSDYTVILSSDDYFHPEMKDVIDSIDGSDMVFFNLSYNIKGKMRRPTTKNYKYWAGSCKLVDRSFMDDVRASNALVNEDKELYELLLKKPHTVQFTDIMGKHYNTPRLGSLTDRKQKGEFGQEFVTVGSEAHWRRFNQENGIKEER